MHLLNEFMYGYAVRKPIWCLESLEMGIGPGRVVDSGHSARPNSAHGPKLKMSWTGLAHLHTGMYFFSPVQPKNRGSSTLNKRNSKN